MRFWLLAGLSADVAWLRGWFIYEWPWTLNITWQFWLLPLLVAVAIVVDTWES
jgi:hypothetical protein